MECTTLQLDHRSCATWAAVARAPPSISDSMLITSSGSCSDARSSAHPRRPSPAAEESVVRIYAQKAHTGWLQHQACLQKPPFVALTLDRWFKPSRQGKNMCGTAQQIMQRGDAAACKSGPTLIDGDAPALVVLGLHGPVGRAARPRLQPVVEAVQHRLHPAPHIIRAGHLHGEIMCNLTIHRVSPLTDTLTSGSTPRRQQWCRAWFTMKH